MASQSQESQLLGKAIVAGLAGIALLVLGIMTLREYLDTSDTQGAEKFREAPKETIEAKVESSGIEYGSPECPEPFGHYPYAECPVDPECQAAEAEAFPQSVARRRLKGCSKSYANWFRVSFISNGTMLHRCVYEYGTHSNSWKVSWEDVKSLHDSHPNGTKLEVWALPSPEQCVVGFGDLQELVDDTKTSIWIPIVAFAAAIICCAGAFFVCCSIPSASEDEVEDSEPE
eukprot:gnl/TRDRNA2_/TRDRNA2_65326_c0_seq1.p1 gnl/TRDRNA2_/TRDRNA2_65326_c0~~gnl/TRDRNA2_/TRDRNA2_65326_c0_seq1.p1  ORF type:complete len:230 (+),score=27.17 gnl/TRDRNA2_/TRDRNA2_65326_c0_seq1:105-794(+)